MTAPTVSLVKDGFTVLASLMERLPEYKRVEVRDLHSKAIGYVWGFQDARNERSTDLSWDFGHAYAIHAAYFALGEKGSRMPIQEAFRSWSLHKEIRPYGSY